MSKSDFQANLESVLETRAQAAAKLAYLKAKAPVSAANRLHKNKSLYFAKCGDAVKIGVSSSPEIRIETLQTGAPGKIVLLTTVANAGHRESECHKRLAHLHLHGEWFRHTDEVDALIKELSNA